MNASGEQQLKGCNWWAAAEVDGNGEQQFEADQCNWGATAEAHTIGEQQLCTESCPAPD